VCGDLAQGADLANKGFHFRLVGPAENRVHSDFQILETAGHASQFPAGFHGLPPGARNASESVMGFLLTVHGNLYNDRTSWRTSDDLADLVDDEIRGDSVCREEDDGGRRVSVKGFDHFYQIGPKKELSAG